MTEYIVLIVGDDERWWNATSPEDQQAVYAQYEHFAAEVTRRGHTITSGAELHSVREARTVRPGGVVTDGPFAETSEHVGGYFRIESADLDDLLACCQILAALGDTLEVRRLVTDEERAS